MTDAVQTSSDTVLVVDDTPESLRFLTDTLEAAGVAVLIATTGEAAVELLEHIVPDLILMDAVMPGMGGFEATRTIKRNPAWSHVPVIFLTGLTESEHVVNALDSGGVDYVRKPIVVDELLARVRVHLSNARLAQAGQIALDATGRHLLSIRGEEALQWATPLAETLMSEIEPGWTQESGSLPELIKGQVAKLIQRDNPPGTTSRLELDDSTLELVLIARLRQDESLVRLNLINPQADVARLQQRHGLTQREAEVLLWISYGKPNRVISEILSISPRTVNKHLEQIFEKLGVETRAAAAAFAVRSIAQ